VVFLFLSLRIFLFSDTQELVSGDKRQKFIPPRHKRLLEDKKRAREEPFFICIK
jgi:hypothetical protein